MSNLTQFTDTVTRAYEHAKELGDIPAGEISIYDKLIECPAVVTAPAGSALGGGRQIRAHRIWRRRVARLYNREHGRPVGEGEWWDLDWEAIWNWILENIVPVLKMLLIIVPFII